MTMSYTWDTYNLSNTNFKDNKEKFVILNEGGAIKGNLKKEKDAVKEIGNLLRTSPSSTFYIYEAVAEFTAKTPEIEREEL